MSSSAHDEAPDHHDDERINAPLINEPFIPANTSEFLPESEAQGESMFTRSPASFARDRVPRTRLRGAESFLAEASESSQAWWWEGLIPATGITFIAGDPLTGKSALAVFLSMASRDGGVVAGRRVTPARIIYVKLEHLNESYRDLLRRSRLALGPTDIHHWHIYTQLDLEDDESIEDLGWWADDVEADVIIIDSFRRSHTRDENTSQDAAELMRRLQRLTAGGRRAVVPIHHLTKTTGALRGSTDFTAAADAEVLVSRSGNSLTIRGRNHAGPDVEAHLTMSFADDRLMFEAANQEMSHDDRLEQLLQAAVRACTPGPLGSGQVRAAVRNVGARGSNGEIDFAVREAERRGLLRNQPSPRGHGWVAVPAGGAFSTGAPHASPPSPSQVEPE